MNKQGACILIVDNDIEIIRALRHSLTAHGYTVLTARNAEDALTLTVQQQPDVILLDPVLPGTSGLEVCRKIREVSTMPMIVLSVKDTEEDKVLALDLGADNYITKPFAIKEVLARVRVALRRMVKGQATQTYVQFGPILVDLAQRKVRVDGQEIKLTPTEYELLKIFLTHRGKILTRQMLINQLWKMEARVPVKEHRLHVYVARLRQKLEPVPGHPRFILTIPCVGYHFADEGE
jgi:two-component system KDP operon response regulator KdpE